VNSRPEQGVLPGLGAGRRRAAKPEPQPAEARPVAVCSLELSSPQLDRTFDYLVTPALDHLAQPGVRVAVRFGGRQVGGFIVERRERSDHPGKLSPISRVPSGLPVLTPGLWRLANAVAERQAGAVWDVLRLAVPAAHVSTEKRLLARWAGGPGGEGGDGPAGADGPGGLGGIGGGGPADPVPECLEGLVAGLRAGRRQRAAWTHLPGDDLANGLAAAVAAAWAAGGQTLVVAASDRMVAQVAGALPKGCRVARLVADDGPQARLEAYWSGARGEADVLVGTRAAAFAPLARPALLVLVGDGDSALREPRAPYHHARTVMAVRAGQEGASLLVAGLGRSVEAQALVESGWLGSLAAERPAVRAATPVVHAPTAEDLAAEGATAASRLPGAAFRLIRRGLADGPVLIQVPSAGHVKAGLERTADELARAFPAARVERSGGPGGRLGQVGPEPVLAVATPGAEPVARGGYAAAVLLDAGTWAGRPALDSAVDALRIWLTAAALVRPRQPVLLAGSDGGGAAQALVRWDPVGLAARDLAERRSLGLPPAVKAVVFEGTQAAVEELMSGVQLPESARLIPDQDRTVLLVGLDQARSTVAAVRAAVRAKAVGGRSTGRVRVRVDGELG
jgi:primosomal protein N' (replication factor Y)